MDYPINFSDQLKQHLRALRRARGLTQTQLGELLGIGQVRVADIERDPSAISVAQLFKVLAALDVRLVLRDQRPDSASAAPKTSW